MTADLLFRLCMAHVVGDYLLQANWMALEKKTKDWDGWLSAFIHCGIWTLCVVVALIPEFVAVTPVVVAGYHVSVCIAIGLIFLSHWVLDRYNLIEWWFQVYGSRSYKCFNESYPRHDGVGDWPYSVFAASYTAIVQTVADNGLHLLFLYLIVRYLVLPA